MLVVGHNKRSVTRPSSMVKDYVDAKITSITEAEGDKLAKLAPQGRRGLRRVVGCRGRSRGAGLATNPLDRLRRRSSRPRRSIGANQESHRAAPP
jgi:hypothetical protein